jgi:hypothetical protein
MVADGGEKIAKKKLAVNEKGTIAISASQKCRNNE